jgi:hypothetical protein
MSEYSNTYKRVNSKSTLNIAQLSTPCNNRKRPEILATNKSTEHEVGVKKHKHNGKKNEALQLRGRRDWRLQSDGNSPRSFSGGNGGKILPRKIKIQIPSKSIARIQH